jgi:hypothetical protein
MATNTIFEKRTPYETHHAPAQAHRVTRLTAWRAGFEDARNGVERPIPAELNAELYRDGYAKGIERNQLDRRNARQRARTARLQYAR